MYKCNHCKEIFDEPDVVTEEELHDELDGYFTETFYFEYCPNCGSKDIEDYYNEDEEG